MNTSRTDCHSKDNFLCYTDQGSFLGLRALGRGPVVPFTWLLAQQPDEAAVIQFNARLAQGIFARLLQRSPLPWGRHRWVRNMTLPPIMWLSHQHHGKHFHHLRMQMLDLDVDPETGPGWRLVVQPLEGGGCALSVLVSHTVRMDRRLCKPSLMRWPAGILILAISRPRGDGLRCGCCVTAPRACANSQALGVP